MKISFLVQDLSHNILARPYILAKILQKYFEVEIVGCMFGEGIWGPIASDNSISYKYVKIKGKVKPYRQLLELSRKIEGRVLYAFQPLFSTLGIGLLNKIINGRSLILDIDDWQWGFVKEQYRGRFFGLPSLKTLLFSALNFYRIDSYWNALLFDKMTHYADEITAAATFIQNKFGGTLLYYGRDTDIFNPEKFDKSALRKEYGIENNKKVIMFFGTPRPYKGIEDLIAAVNLIDEPDILLTVFGIEENDSYAKNLAVSAKKLLGDRFRSFPCQDFQKTPYFMAMADVVAIPQKNNFATAGMVPAKVFDAMAMAKPIIATRVSDLPEILKGCGWLIEPENPRQLSETILYVLRNPQEAQKYGVLARQRCIEKYSWKEMEKILLKIFRKYEKL